MLGRKVHPDDGRSLSSGCARDGVTITAANSDLTDEIRALYVGTGGNVQIITPAGTTLLFKNVPNGGIITCAAKQVMTTNTTASDMVGLF